MTKGKKTLNPNLIELNHQDGKSDSEVMAETIHKPELLNALVLNAYSKNIQGEHFNLMKAIGVLEKTNNQIQDSDLSRAEQMLMSQAASLEQIFTNLAIRASMQTDLAWFKTLTTLALKAQNQSRCTLQALAGIKNPSTTTFIKQANLANGHQQINNNDSAGKKTVQTNELLEDGYGITQMDTTAAIKTKPSDTELATLE
jgi:Tfp pilus assembly protein PilE